MEQYKIGDKVITPYGEEAEIMSNGFVKGNKTYYAVEYGDGRLGIFAGEDLLRAEIPFDPSKMSFKISIEDNLAIASAYYDGKEIEKGHGHIFHDGIDGILQSVSYAFKRMWLHYTGQEER